jgi:chromosome partitioning protein
VSKIFAVVNHKGGVGKTVVTINLGAALAIKKQRVLIIDADPQSNTTKALLSKITPIKKTMYHLMDTDLKKMPDPSDYIHPTIRKNLYIVPNELASSGHELKLVMKMAQGQNVIPLLRDRLRDYCLKHFDFVLIDNMPSVGIILSLVMTMADALLIPVDIGNAESMAGVDSILSVMTDINSEINPGLIHAKLIPNRLDKRVSACVANGDALIEKYGKDNIFKTSIPTSADFQTVETMFPKTIFDWKHNGKGPAAFRSIAKELLKSEGLL